MHSADQPQPAWRYLPFSSESAALQLAAADALLAGMAAHPRPALRWYATDAPALILGTGQRPHEADLAAWQAAGVTVHRRASGGTAVLLGPGALLLDIALPANYRLYSHDVTESYHWLGAVWVTTLRTLGLDARMIPIAEARADTQALDALARRACFGGRSPYEVLVAGRKVIGLSQVRRRPGAVLQVGLYTTWKPERLADLLAIQPQERHVLVEQLGSRVAGLNDLLPAAPDAHMIMAAFAAALRDTQRVTLAADDWSAEEVSVRSQASAGRYAPIESHRR